MTWHVPANSTFVEHVTEDAVALRFATQGAGRVRYCHAARAWFVWDGRVWRRDGRGLVLHKVREAAREVAKDPFGKMRAMPGSLRFVTGAERLARTDPAFAVGAEDWDVDPLRLGTPAGTLQLETGEITEADPADGIRRVTAVAPAAIADIPASACPVWRRRLDALTGGDAALAGFLQRLFGRALGGEAAAVVLDGPAGALVALAADILGDYAAPLTSMASPTSVASPRGAASLTAASGVRLLTAGVGDAVGATALPPGATLVVVGPPRVYRADLRGFAARGRVTIVPLDGVFEAPGPEADPADDPADEPAGDAATGEADERPAILRWMAEGFSAWRAEGLAPPPCVVDATRAFADMDSDMMDLDMNSAADSDENLNADAQDVFADFLAAACDCAPGADEPTASAGALFAAWSRHARAAGARPGSPRTFAAAMRAHGFASDRRAHGRLFRGLALRKDDGMTA